MHKPLFCLIVADSQQDAYDNANEDLETRIEHSSIDWYQGIIESQRWPEFEKYDKAIKFNEEIKQVLEKLLDESEFNALKWIDNGISQLEKYRQNQEVDLQTAIDSFSIGSGDIHAHILDLTNYSNDFVISKSMFYKILEYVK